MFIFFYVCSSPLPPSLYKFLFNFPFSNAFKLPLWTYPTLHFCISLLPSPLNGAGLLSKLHLLQALFVYYDDYLLFLINHWCHFCFVYFFNLQKIKTNFEQRKWTCMFLYLHVCSIFMREKVCLVNKWKGKTLGSDFMKELQKKIE